MQVIKFKLLYSPCQHFLFSGTYHTNYSFLLILVVQIVFYTPQAYHHINQNALHHEEGLKRLLRQASFEDNDRLIFDDDPIVQNNNFGRRRSSFDRQQGSEVRQNGFDGTNGFNNRRPDFGARPNPSGGRPGGWGQNVENFNNNGFGGRQNGFRQPSFGGGDLTEGNRGNNVFGRPPGFNSNGFGSQQQNDFGQPSSDENSDDSESGFGQRPSSGFGAIPPTPSTTTTPAVPGMGTTQTSCEFSCLKTPQYNPVCGSNGVTYFNEGAFRCAQRCGQSKLVFPKASRLRVSLFFIF